MKFYAVKKGRIPGIYRSWDAAKTQVDKYPNAEYKSFVKITDAVKYLDWDEATKKQIMQKDEDDLKQAILKVKHVANQNHQSLIAKNEQTQNNFAIIYTDGGTRNTGNYKGGHVKATDKAAWAYQIKFDNQEVHGTAGEFGATNNKMEQQALIEAMKKLIELGFNQKKLLFVLDSRYVLDAINKKWLASWKKRGWKRANGELTNKKQWQQLDKLLEQFPNSNFKWTKGHAGNAGNEFVDHLLNKTMDKM